MPGSAATPPPTTRRKILDAALAVFSDRGFDGTSVRDVCARAGVNVAAVNYHYGSKADLWLAVCTECAERFGGIVRARIDLDGGAAEVVESIVGGLFDALRESEMPARILTWASMQSSSLDFEEAARPFRPLVDTATRLVERLQEEGRLPADVDLEAVVPLLYGQIVFMVVDQPGHRLHFGQDFSNEAFAARMRAATIRSAKLLFGLPDEERSVVTKRQRSGAE